MRARAGRGVTLGVAVGVLAAASPAWAAPTLTLQAPTAGRVVGPELTWSMKVQSSYATFPSFKVRFAGELKTDAVNLQRQPGTWSGYFRTTEAPEGPQTLELELTDGANETSTVSVDVVNNHPPTPALIEPVSPVGREIVVGTQVRVRASCTDVGLYGCATLEILLGEVGSGSTTVLATGGPSTFDQVLTLPVGARRLLVRARDTQGAEATTAEAQLYVTDSVHVARVDEVPGTVLDADATRTLFTDGASVFVKTRSTGQVTTLGPGAATSGALAPLGAVWNQAVAPFGSVAWNGTVRSDVGAGAKVKGSYAAWYDPTTQAVVREDLVTTQRVAVTQGGFALAPAVGVNAGGDVAWTSGSGPSARTPHVWHDGTVTTFASTKFETLAMGEDFLLGGYRSGEVWRAPFDGGPVTMLLGPRAPTPNVVPSVYAAGSWGTFHQFSTDGALSAVHANGAIEEVSPYATGNSPLAISPSGDVVYAHASAGKGVYLGRSNGGVPQTPLKVAVGAPSGRFAWFDGAFHWLYGRTVLKIGANLGGLGVGVPPVDPPDAGPADGGAPDAAPLADASVPEDGAAPEGGPEAGPSSSSGGASSGASGGTSSGGTSSGGTGGDGGSSGADDDADPAGCSQGGHGAPGTTLGLVAATLFMLRGLAKRRRREGESR